MPSDDCVLGRHGGKVDFLLVGDSHANHFSGFWDELGKGANKRGYDITRDTAAFLPSVQLKYASDPGYERAFILRNNYVSSLLVHNHYDFIVLAGNYSALFNEKMIKAKGENSDDAFKDGLRSAISQASTSASQVVVMTTIPQLDDGLYDCGLRAARFGIKSSCTLPISRYITSTARVREVFFGLQAEFPNVLWIDAAKLLCSRTDCVTEMDGIPLYKNAGHLNDVGSRLLADKWIAKYGNPLQKKFGEKQGSESTSADWAGKRPGKGDGGMAWKKVSGTISRL